YQSQGGWKVSFNEQIHQVECELNGHQLTAVIDGARLRASAIVTEAAITIMYGPYQHTVELKSKHYISDHEHEAAPLAAPLNGTVVKHLLAVGTQVNKGDAVVIIEAMKMEYTLNAPFDGTLTSYCFAEGELVSHGDMLAIVEEQD
ncbi:3-methylcrotonyl-CoA carboxylase, partial [Pseudoalteromonas piscicida]